jgi:hypothetical protein
MHQKGLPKNSLHLSPIIYHNYHQHEKTDFSFPGLLEGSDFISATPGSDRYSFAQIKNGTKSKRVSSYEKHGNNFIFFLNIKPHLPRQEAQRLCTCHPE